MNSILSLSLNERFNVLTHLSGLVLTLLCAWTVLVPAYTHNWINALAATIFIAGTLAMYTSSTLYHWCQAVSLKRLFRILDHIGIYVMIASSYTPICLCVVGGWLGWLVFSLLWLTVVAGAVYKFLALGRWPALSLGIYLAMGWSGVLMAMPVYRGTPVSALVCICAEGLFYTSGTYFFVRDSRSLYHGIWHLFVLAGSICHWVAVWIVLSI